MNYAAYVDPMIGTVGDEQGESFHGGGKTHPGACMPGGMVQLSPDTVTGGDNGTGYNYCQNTIEGFSFNHMSGIGWYGDLGNLQVMPVTGKTDLRSGSNEEIPFVKGTEGWKSSFSHEKEHAKAGYYSVELEKYAVTAEATVSMHTGFLRFTYPENSEAGIIFNFSRRIAGHADFQEVKLLSDTSLEGRIHCTPAGGGFGRGVGGIGYDLYFACELSKPAEKMQFFSNEAYLEEGLTECEGEDLGLRVSFSTKEQEQIILKCGISYTDLEGARNHLKKEASAVTFDEMVSLASEAWDKELETIKVFGSDETDKKLFYTCLYHALLDPRCAVDADGRFKSADGQIRRVPYTHRTMFSGWDVYRSEFPLLTLIRPEIVNDEINSLITIAEQAGTSLPRWELMGIDSHCMVGDPGLIITGDAYVKGIRNFDVSKAYEIGKASSDALTEFKGKSFVSNRPDAKQYREEAYVPKSLSSTLEFLLADYVMAQFAKGMDDDARAEKMLERVKTYQKNYNPETGFMGPRDEEGNFIPVQDEYDERGCVESNIFQQSWFVPYDLEGLSELFGKERMLTLLERLFEKADLTALWNVNYNHSNEPCHNITHYFNVLGKPERTQYWTRRVQKEAYRTGAFGFCGNEDVGQLSGWYVLSAMGFAQICPGDPRYMINTPLFQNIEISLDKKYQSCAVADTLKIVCDHDPLEYPYIREIRFNGKKLEDFYISYEEMTQGGTLEFQLMSEAVEER